MRRYPLILILIILCSANSYSQAQKSAGLTIYSNFDDLKQANLGLGVHFEHPISSLIGLEFGVTYRSRREIGSVTFTGESSWTKHYTIRQDFISFPVLAKVYTPFMAISAGLSLDYFAGWSHTDGSEDFRVTTYSINPEFYPGWMVKLGRPIPVKGGLILEPELAYSATFGYGISYLSVGIALRMGL